MVSSVRNTFSQPQEGRVVNPQTPQTTAHGKRQSSSTRIAELCKIFDVLVGPAQIIYNVERLKYYPALPPSECTKAKPEKQFDINCSPVKSSVRTSSLVSMQEVESSLQQSAIESNPNAQTLEYYSALPPILARGAQTEEQSSKERDPIFQPRALVRHSAVPPMSKDSEKDQSPPRSLPTNPPWISGSVNVEKEKRRRRNATALEMAAPLPAVSASRSRFHSRLPVPISGRNTNAVAAAMFDSPSTSQGYRGLKQAGHSRIPIVVSSSRENATVAVNPVSPPEPQRRPSLLPACPKSYKKKATSSRVKSRIPVPLRYLVKAKAQSKKGLSRIPVLIRKLK